MLMAIFNRIVESQYEFCTETTVIECKTNNDNRIFKIADTIKIIGIRIERELVVELSNLKKMVLCFGENEFWNIPFELLLSLSKVIKTKKNFIIMFPDKMLSYDSDFQIKMVALHYTSVTINIISESDIKFELLLLNHFYVSPARRRFATKVSNDIVMKYDTYDFENTNTIRPNTKGSYIGFFLKTDRDIDYIKLSLHGLLLFKLDSEILKYVHGKLINRKRIWTKEHNILMHKLPICDDVLGKIMNEFIDKSKIEHLYWIPFDYGVNWYDNEKRIIQINENRYCEIEFDKPINGYVCFIGYNKMKHDNGFATLESL